jgi:hypothetical protein
MGLERGPLSLVRITEELLEWKNSDFGSKKLKLTAMGIFFYSEKKLVTKKCLGLSIRPSGTLF